MICVFGLFHGLVTLPVVLSFIGTVIRVKLASYKIMTIYCILWATDSYENRQHFLDDIVS